MSLPLRTEREMCAAPVIVAASRQLAHVLALASRAAASEAKILITGETGVGKDLIASTIHYESQRAAGPFIPVNCAGLPETLLESELFGHVKGSFTGAFCDRPGKLRQAHNGTLFLDELAEMTLRMQAVLLRFLETGELQAVGAHGPATAVNVRTIAATHCNLEERVDAGLFREDLFYRLAVIHIHVPPLRERREDIPVLVEHFLARSRRARQVSADAMEALQRHTWPGNVRELQNVIEQAAWLADGDLIEARHLPAPVRPSGVAILSESERRRSVADDLYDALVSGGYSFWEHVHPLLLARDITRDDVRQLVSRGLRTTRGSYRALLRLFGMRTAEYKRFHNFLVTFGCRVDYRTFRHGELAPQARAPRVSLPAPSTARAVTVAAAGSGEERGELWKGDFIKIPAWRPSPPTSSARLSSMAARTG